MEIPKKVKKYYEKYKVPVIVRKHSKNVAITSYKVGEALNKKGIRCDKEKLYLAGLLHDILKCVDFHNYDNFDEKTKKTFHSLQKKYPYHHTKAAYLVLKDDEPKIAKLILLHGFQGFPKCKTMEEKILNYVDKRVKHDKIASLKDRLDDLKRRYKEKVIKSGQNSQKIEQALVKFEKELKQKIGEKEFKKIFKEQ